MISFLKRNVRYLVRKLTWKLKYKIFNGDKNIILPENIKGNRILILKGAK